MRKFLPALMFITTVVAVTGISSCRHDISFDDDIMMPSDTLTNPIDTLNDPCDPDVVYFQYEVLPILISNCSTTGCHNAASHEKGVILESYQSLMETTDFEPYNLEDTEIYEMITESGDDRMPPSPNAPLSPEQIQLIATWILQGGKNLDCDWEAEACDTENVTYSQVISPVISTYCLGCHSGANPGGGHDFSSHSGLKEAADSGHLLGAINWDSGYPAMPQGGDRLPQCTINRIKAWIDAGAPNN